MYRLVYTSNPNMTHHLQQDFDVYVDNNLRAIDKDGKGFTTSKIEDSTALAEGGIIVKTQNSVYIFAFISSNLVSDYSGFGFY